MTGELTPEFQAVRQAALLAAEKGELIEALNLVIKITKIVGHDIVPDAKVKPVPPVIRHYLATSLVKYDLGRRDICNISAVKESIKASIDLAEKVEECDLVNPKATAFRQFGSIRIRCKAPGKNAAWLSTELN